LHYKCSAMAKSEVYSWRVASETKSRLERAAREANQSLGRLLDRIASDWLEATRSGDDAPEQARLHEVASKCLGALQRARPYGAAETRRVIRERLGERYGRQRSD
jgi:hypothetical protein